MAANGWDSGCCSYLTCGRVSVRGGCDIDGAVRASMFLGGDGSLFEGPMMLASDMGLLARSDFWLMSVCALREQRHEGRLTPCDCGRVSVGAASRLDPLVIGRWSRVGEWMESDRDDG